ncbi:MAG: hypothetical protein OJF49_002885 [Ktedonobacterales bacterium]|nr:MAG: hypothetical protein OJF49_002885 [Ktedonobacterales bacterium]
MATTTGHAPTSCSSLARRGNRWERGISFGAHLAGTRRM